MFAYWKVLVLVTILITGSFCEDVDRKPYIDHVCARDLFSLVKFKFKDAAIMIEVASGKSLPMDAGNFDFCIHSDRGRYFLVQGTFSTPHLANGYPIPWKLGLCLPRSCTSLDIHRVVTLPAHLDKLLPHRHVHPKNSTSPEVVIGNMEELQSHLLRPIYESPLSPFAVNGTLNSTTTLHNGNSSTHALQVEKITSPDDDIHYYDSGTIVAVLIIVFLLLLCLSASLMDYYYRVRNVELSVWKASQGQSYNKHPNPAEYTKIDDVEEIVEIRDEERRPLFITNNEHQPRENEEQHTNIFEDNVASVTVLNKEPTMLLYRFFMLFSLFRTYQELTEISMSTRYRHLDFLNGVRVLSMFWIILGHTYSMTNTVAGYRNPQHIALFDYSDSRKWYFEFLIGASFAVDTFFFIGAFLLCYFLQKKINIARGRLNPVVYFLFRYIRLTPAMALAILFYYKISPLLIYSPFSSSYYEHVNVPCQKYWWTHLLYINNFYPVEYRDQCMIWLWYLGNDYIYYLFAPILLLIYCKSKRLGIASLVFTLLVCMGSTFAIVMKNKTVGMYLFNVTESKSMFTNLYGNPLYRANSYIMGVATAWLYLSLEHNSKFRKAMTAKHIRFVLYVFALFCLLLPILIMISDYATPDSWTTIDNAFYCSLSGLSWGLGLMAFSFLCLFGGERDLFCMFLSSDRWKVPAKLTYCAYLFHPVVVMVSAASGTQFINYDAYTIAYRWIANSAISFMVAFFAYLLIEGPCVALLKVLKK